MQESFFFPPNIIIKLHFKKTHLYSSMSFRLSLYERNSWTKAIKTLYIYINYVLLLILCWIRNITLFFDKQYQLYFILTLNRIDFHPKKTEIIVNQFKICIWENSYHIILQYVFCPWSLFCFSTKSFSFQLIQSCSLCLRGKLNLCVISSVSGWKTIKGALAMPLMIKGFKKDLIKFAIITCRKPE